MYVLTDLLCMACDGGVPRALSVWTQLSGPTTGSVCVGGEHDNSEWVEELSTLTGGPDSGCNIFLIVLCLSYLS